MNKVIFGGFVMGALAVGFFHQGTLFLLFHVGHLWPALEGAVGRPPFPGWDLGRDVPGMDVPLLAAQAAVGGVWGMVLAALVRWAPVPDLLAGAVLGVVAGAALPSVLDQGAAVARAALAGAGFGWGCALLLRVIEVRPLGALRMRHQWAPKD